MAFTIEVHGLKNLLGELRKFEPELYKTIRDDLLMGANDLVQAVGADFPQQPLKNWHSTGGRKGKSRLPAYDASKARKGIKAVVPTSGRKSGILRIEQRDAGGQVYDAAGGKSISRFVQNLDKKGNTRSKPPKPRSRLMFTSVADHIKLVEDDILKAIGKTEKMIETKIVRDA
jgi:hypothetical protein